MQIMRAAHLGMCFGVRDAIDLAVRRSDTAPLTVLGDLVHNDAVLAGLRARGIATAKDPAESASWSPRTARRSAPWSARARSVSKSWTPRARSCTWRIERCRRSSATATIP